MAAEAAPLAPGATPPAGGRGGATIPGSFTIIVVGAK
jgi:hypothetical protein